MSRRPSTVAALSACVAVLAGSAACDRNGEARYAETPSPTPEMATEYEPEMQPAAGEPRIREGEPMEETLEHGELERGPAVREAEPMPGAGVTLSVETYSAGGQYLTDAEGRALYMFTADKAGQSNCYDACAEAWPPLVTEKAPEAGEDMIQQNLMGTIRRKDGSIQVTYAGMPLYYFRADTAAGMTTGQDVHGHGGEWYLVTPDGTKLESEEGE